MALNPQHPVLVTCIINIVKNNWIGALLKSYLKFIPSALRSRDKSIPIVTFKLYSDEEERKTTGGKHTVTYDVGQQGN